MRYTKNVKRRNNLFEQNKIMPKTEESQRYGTALIMTILPLIICIIEKDILLADNFYATVYYNLCNCIIIIIYGRGTH